MLPDARLAATSGGKADMPGVPARATTADLLDFRPLGGNRRFRASRSLRVLHRLGRYLAVEDDATRYTHPRLLDGTRIPAILRFTAPKVFLVVKYSVFQS